jgi:hypothetical protein
MTCKVASRNNLVLTIFIILVTFCIIPSVFAGQDELLLQSEVLKHRVEIHAVPPPERRDENVNVFIIKTEAWRELLLDESVTIEPHEWINIQDLIKREVSSSDIFRVTNNGLARLKGEESSELKAIDVVGAPLIMLVKFGIGQRGKGLFIYLVNAGTGNTLYTTSAWGQDMRTIIRKMLAELEEKVLFMAWRCKVVDRRGNEMIIDRGRLDGISKGQKLIGYSISADAWKSPPVSQELFLMKYGTRRGVYVVSEEGEEYSKISPQDSAPMLREGDIVEMPAITFKKRERDTRGRRIWDKIYRD